jgi:Carboxypeptidase regulatory-like domain
MFHRTNIHAQAALCLLAFSVPILAQNASLTGIVKDPRDAAVSGAALTLTNKDTGVSISTKSDAGGDYTFSAIKPGKYSLKAEQAGFKTFLHNELTLLVDERSRLDVVLQIGEAATVVTVEANVGGVQTESSSLGEVVTNTKIVEVPLNGRFFLDIALLTAGTVAPSTNNRTFLAVPSGIGISGINASGAREDATNYMFDGINLSDMVQNQITFQPNIDMIQEFKVQTNAFTAEYGRNAGIIINGVSKSGSNGFHGTAYEFVRNEIFDAKNYFDPAGPITPFKRNIYGYSVGGPIIRNRTFFFTSYEGRQGREQATLKTQVPTDAQRATATNPVIVKLLGLIPAPNDSTGTFFQGVAPRRRSLNQFTGRIDHSFNERNVIFGNFLSNRDERTEPTLQGNNLPGFGDSRPATREFLALGYNHVFTPTITNEFRAGMNRVKIAFNPVYTADPATFGITSPSTVFPDVVISGGAVFGGISGFPQGRGDTTFQYSDTVSWIRGRHSIKFGAEYRRFRNNNFNNGTGGVLNFANLASFLAGTASSSTQTSLPATPGYRVNALGIFVQDDFKVSARLTVNMGIRWEYNGVPSEIHNRLGIYDFTKNVVTQVGTNGFDGPYNKQFTNFGPRLGFSYDPFGKGKTVIRAGSGIYFDQPVTNVIGGLSTNPPFSSSVNITSNVNLSAPFSQPPGSSSAIGSVDPNFKSGVVYSYNFNIQQEVLNTVVQISYVGSQSRHLRLTGDYNQGVNGLRPIPNYSSIGVQESVSNANYNGLWLSANKRMTKDVTFSASYTFSKSIDNNSVSSSNPQIQNFYNIGAEHALSDFDARHRFVFSGVYLVPFKADNGFTKRLVEGWSISPIVNLQTGNPFSPIVALTRTLTPGTPPVPGTIYNSGSLEAFDRPNLVQGQSLLVPNPNPTQYINPAAFVRANLAFGNAGRNILTAPGLQDIDVALSKNTVIKERVSLQFRAEAFNIFNHPNFAQPVNAFTAATFGQITATRTTRGDLGSSRQLQLGMKLIF